VDHLLLIGETDGDPDVEARLVEEMVDRQVEGIIYATVVTAEVTVPETLAAHPVVLLNCVDPVAGLPAVLPDEHEGGRAAAGLLLRAGVAGAVHAVGLDPTPGALSGRLRVEGLRAALAEAGHTLRGVIPCDWDVVPAYDAVRAWLAQGHRTEAFVCLNDRVAMGTYQALEERGLVVPDDVSVVSFDGSDLAGWLRPALSTVALPYAEMGALAVRRLADSQLERGRSVVRVPMSVIEGRSVGPRRTAFAAERAGDSTRRREGTVDLG
jgi:LacI family transcriptional regulator